jgi:zinc protease
VSHADDSPAIAGRALVVAAALVASLFSAPASAAEGSPDLPTERYRLANGLRVVLAPDPRLDTASLFVRYDAGSADDPEDKQGLAHLVEHLMYGASRHLGPGDYARWVARSGGTAQALTWRDRTEYMVTAPAQAIPRMLWLESERMGFLSQAITEDAVRAARWLILDEARDLHCLRGSIGQFAGMALFPAWHPYRRNDCTGAVLNASLADVRAFLATWYQPANATLVIAGPFDASAVGALVATYFGSLRSTDPPLRPVLPADWPAHCERIDIAASGPRDIVNLQWRAPALGAPADATLDVVATMLADQEGPLRRTVTARGADALEAREASSRGDSIFEVAVSLPEGGSIDAVIDDVERAVRDLAAQPDGEGLDRARQRWSDKLALRLETSLGRARMLSEYDAPLGLDPRAGVGPTDVVRAVATYLLPLPRVVVVLHHGKQYPREGVVLSRKEQAL